MLKKNIMGIRSSVILNRYNANFLVMEALDAESEEFMDNLNDLGSEIYFLKKVNKETTLKIPARDIFLYGDIDINNPEDLSLIEKADIITQKINQAANIPSDFDYETGYVYANNEDIYKTHDTWNKIDWFKFNHCLIGKPSKIIIYRINKSYVPRDRSIRNNNC